MFLNGEEFFRREGAVQLVVHAHYKAQLIMIADFKFGQNLR